MSDNNQALSRMRNFDEFFEKISSFYDQHPLLSKELVKAKEYYFNKTGKLSEMDHDFSNRMNAFLLWFTYDWRCSQNLSSPFEVYQEHLKRNNFLDEYSKTQGQDNHIHSLFEYVKIKNGKTIIKDLYSKQKYQISDKKFLIGCLKGAFFETRLFKEEDDFYFPNYYIPHPIEVNRYIKKRNKQIVRKGESIKPFLITLHAYHTKWEKYRNIDIKSIYHFDKSVPEAK